MIFIIYHNLIMDAAGVTHVKLKLKKVGGGSKLVNGIQQLQFIHN